MSRETIKQVSFNAGVLSPRLYARNDLEKYPNAVAECVNMIPMPAGPVTLRPGTIYSAEVLDSTKKSRLIPFSYNALQNYIIEFGDSKVRFFRAGIPVKSETAFTNGTFTGGITGWTTNSTGTGSATYGTNNVQLAGGASGVGSIYQELTYLGVGEYTITGTVTTAAVTVKVGTTAGASDIASGTLAIGAGSTFTFTPSLARTTFFVTFQNPANSTAVLDTVSLSTPDYVIDSPYALADVPSVRYTQDADVLYLVRKSTTIVPKVLKRYGNAAWEFGDLEFVDGPYFDINTTATTITPSATTGTITLTASTAIFASTDVGRAVRIKHSSTWGWVKITAFTSTTVVTGVVQSTLGGTGAVKDWRLGRFSATTGYPGVVGFQEGRLVFSNTATNPNFVWMSESLGAGSNKVLFAPSEVSGTVTDSNSITIQLTAGGASPVVWLSSGHTLAIGTADSEWIVEAGDVTKAISPTNTRATRRTNHGSLDNTDAVRIDGTVLYGKRTGRVVNKFDFSFERDEFLSSSVTILADSLFATSNIAELVYAQDPFSLCWVRFDSGELAAGTVVVSEDVTGWAKHRIAGTDADVESLATIRSESGNYTETWMIVKRTVDGSTVRYIEYFAEPFYLDEPKTAVYVDSAVVYSGTAVTTLTGLDHLEGEQVSILADGVAVPAQEVVSGQITLDTAAQYVVVGLPYEGIVETLDFDAPNDLSGTSMGQTRRISDVVVRLFETGLISMRRAAEPDSKYTLLEPRQAATLMDTAPPLFSGQYRIPFVPNYERSSRLRFKVEGPTPATLCAVYFKAQVNEG
jgi:hypothetical protein